MAWRRRIAELLLACACAIPVAPRRAAAQDRPPDEPFWADIAEPGRARGEQLVARAATLVEGFPREAAALVEQAIAADGGNGFAYYLLGQARYRERSWSRCADALEALARLDPSYTPPARPESSPWPAADDMLGLCLALAGRYDAAVALYRRLLLAPAGAAGLDTLHGNLADCYLALGRLDEAIGEYLAAIALSPRRALFYFGLAVAYDRDERVSRATEAMLRALELDANLVELGSPSTYFVPPEDAHYYHGLAHQVAAEADPPRRLAAIAHFRKYLALVPAGPWLARARAHLAELGPAAVTARDVMVHPHDGPEAELLARRFAAAAPELQRCLDGHPTAALRVSLAFSPAAGRARVPAQAAFSWSSQGPDGIPVPDAECVEKRLQALRFASPRYTRLTAVLVSR